MRRRDELPLTTADGQAARYQSYFCTFKIYGGGTLRIPYREIRRIQIDPEILKSRLFVHGEQSPIYISNTPDEILHITEIMEQII